ncbi:aldo/keto reductase [Haloglomus halophilum]|uniref:aldo/keto reductase n=1 Tax=Haloglomus halophilum TaxID=2962672 RepID=UPI0020C9ABF4|nr:aldo/keto reductase [Haloglomus halophilum]
MESITVQGVEVPRLGLGTWRLTGDDCREAVGTALDLGYRHIDTAQVYTNERQVGDALAASDVPREEVFLATKLGPQRSSDDVLRTTEESLARLGTDYLDLLLIHWPNGRPPGSPPNPLASAPDHAETLDAMNELVESGTVRNIGVSNFDVDQLDAARELSDAPILTDQVQYHPFWDQQDLLSYCRVHDVLLTAYSPLGHGGVLDDPVLERIARRHAKTPAQVALRWLVQQDQVATIPKATSREHLEANMAIFDFELTETEMREIRRPSTYETLKGFLKARVSG